MRLSIRFRMILAMNVLVAAVGIAVGYAGIKVAAGEIERKVLHESAANAAALIGRSSWPLTDALMTQVAQILGAETAITPLEGKGIDAASLPPAERTELADQLAASASPSLVTLASGRYRVGLATIRRVSPDLRSQKRRLVLLVPEQRLQAAKRQVAARIALFTLAAVLIATGVAFWLSTSLSRPVRKLADRMDRLARGELPLSAARPAGRGPGRTAPTELARLTRSFDELLGRLADARHQLDRSARLAALGQLSASVAHELRNPLSGIKMNARVLADELARTGQTDRSLQIIIREIDRMDLYLQELISLAAASDSPAQAAAQAATPVRLDELAESVAELLAGRCEHAGVRIERNYRPDAPPALADAGRTRQVILNLLLNALDVMPHGGTLGLAVRPGEQPARVRMEVRDTGPGVHPPHGADIFEPFVTTKAQGTGLGLYVCRRVVEGLGGHIGYESSDRGATFWFDLPA